MMETLKNIIKISLSILTVGILFVSCKAPEDKVLNSLGEYKEYVYYSEGEFQDYTDYGKYYYDSADLADNAYFIEVENYDLSEINEHLADFEAWIETYREGDPSCEIVVNYDFDREIIDREDYIHINSEKFTTTWDDGMVTNTFASYEIYFFDTQTQVLYFFHNNI